ncbi:MAG: TonB-dependent receptor [Pseudohongiellaceae bacterium]|nr:TonB-dependent receptor [Pseudohongiellaceae bacterium]
MSRSIPFRLLTLCSTIAACNLSLAQEELVIIGSAEQARNVAGSGSVISADQIRIESATDINQLLKTVPGIYIREEDGAGLRPNIGIRGATSERSSKITLMEDGVMVAPAPYADPSAYYFPTAARQTAVEVLKGAPLLRYGPQTTGGVVNLVSTPIPTQSGGSLDLSADERGSTDIHATYGQNNGQVSWLLETVQRDAKGFKDIDRSSRDTGFDIEDYVAKLAWESAGNGPKQRLFLKAQYSEELSNETYLGLTDRDFDADEDRRYGLTDIDQMDNRHSAIQASYSIELTEQLSANIMAYSNRFYRDWFKLDGGSSYINAANNGDANAIGILNGDIDEFGLKYKHNNRHYESDGVELSFNYSLAQHEIDFGIRSHDDSVDRFQPVEIYNQINGSLVYDSIVAPSSSNNRVGKAEALSAWIVDTWQVNDRLRVTTTLRHEDVESEQQRYNDSQRTIAGSYRSNDSSEWLPGSSFTYELNDNWQVLAGVHRGFSPLGSGGTATEDPETSLNWEAGLRYANNGWFIEGIAFDSRFEDKSENCSLASPCSNGDTSGTYTTGEADISGIELQLSTVFEQGRFTIPLDASYTWTDAEISKDNGVTGVQKGDLLKDVPEQVFSIRTGLEHRSGWNNYIVAKYIDEQCVSVSCNRSASPYAETESLFVVDLISRYPVSENIDTYLKVENLFDEQAIISRNPDGARPNKARTASLGVEVRF